MPLIQASRPFRRFEILVSLNKGIYMPYRLKTLSIGDHWPLSYLKGLQMRLSCQTSSMSTLRHLIAYPWNRRSLAAYQGIARLPPFDSWHFLNLR